MAQYARPDSDVTKGSWSISSGTDLYAVLDEASASDTDSISRLGGDDTCEVGLSNVTDPSSSSGHVLRVRTRKQGAGNINSLTAYLYQGSTLIASTACSLTSSFVTTEYTLSSAEANNISDYSDLRVRIVLDWQSGFITGALVSWIEFECPDAGGTTYTCSVAGSLTAAGGMARGSGKGVVGSLTVAGGLARCAGKGLAGTMAAAGVVAAVRVILVALAGAVTAAGGLARRVGKGLAGAVTLAGGLARRVGKGLAGTVTAAGAVAATRVILVALAGAVTAAGGLARRVSKGLAGVLVPAGGLARRVSKGFGGAVTLVGGLARRAGKGLGGAVALAGGLARRVGKGLGGAVTAVGGLARRASKGLAGVLVPAGGLARLVGKGLAGVLTVIGGLVRQLFRRKVRATVSDWRVTLAVLADQVTNGAALTVGLSGLAAVADGVSNSAAVSSTWAVRATVNDSIVG